jgi:hypothetical protein
MGELHFDKNTRWIHHNRTLWARFATLFLGLWLLTAPTTFGYEDELMLARSDRLSGLLLVILSTLALNFRLRSLAWIIAFLGMWIGFSPLAFWAKSPAAYMGDMIIAALVIGFSVIVPYRPEGVESDPEIPMGWSYNPSSWQQRAPVIFFGCFGWFVARYLAGFELGYLSTIWDPFFGDGTIKVLSSNVSKAFPFADAGMGAYAYMLEALLGAKGGKRRWYTMPWMVIAFGVLVIPLGFTSILLVILQPSVVGAWCGPCLVMAFCMLIMLALTVDEVLATLQFLHQAHKEGNNLWRIFWFGGKAQGSKDGRSLHLKGFHIFKSMTWGVTVPLNLLLTILIGVWMLCVPNALGIIGLSADGCYIIGALTIVFSIIGMAEVTRAIRYINILLGVGVIALPWVLTPTECSAVNQPLPLHCESFMWNGIITGALLILLSLPRGRIKESYGSWNYFIV